jgi:hypothetical protein
MSSQPFFQSLPTLSADQGWTLQQPPTVEEIMGDMFSLGPDKACGPDVLNARLIQTF